MGAEIQLMTRADDAGSCYAANRGIELSYRSGLLRNISVMAVGPAIQDAAERLAKIKDVSFGLHITMNSEWDEVKWNPLRPAKAIHSLLDGNGQFCSSPSLFKDMGVQLEHVCAEMDAQLDCLTRLGFDVAYADEHMFFHWGLEGFKEELDHFCKRKGLLNFHHYHRDLPHAAGDMLYPESSIYENTVLRLQAALQACPAGLYTLILHPGENEAEMKRFGNAEVKGSQVALEREADARLLHDARIKQMMEDRGVSVIRYAEATRLSGIG